jgi:hypothetical protein
MNVNVTDLWKSEREREKKSHKEDDHSKAKKNVCG